MAGLTPNQQQELHALRDEYTSGNWPEELKWQFWTMFAALINACPEGSNNFPANFPDLPKA